MNRNSYLAISDVSCPHKRGRLVAEDPSHRDEELQDTSEIGAMEVSVSSNGLLLDSKEGAGKESVEERSQVFMDLVDL